MPAVCHVLVISNADSGRGNASGVVARAMHEMLVSRVSPRLLQVDRADPTAFMRRFREAVPRSDVLVVAGGDGTLHHALPVVTGTQVPVYHLPLGTENLFAREFDSCRDPRRLLRAVLSRQSRAVDVGLAAVDGGSATPFALMASIGPDAGVIRRLHAARTGAITHLSYIQPIWEELLEPSLPAMTIEADGRVLVSNTRGMLIIANSRQYGGRLDPARDAKVDDGLLDVVFFPATTGPAAGLWMLRSLVGVHATHPSAITTRARRVAVRSGSPMVHQMDGELGTRPAHQLEFAVQPRALRVLLPGD
ncbi:MAG TPA: diacylglycerol kinase family protein [Phycisphaerales bacterium]|nr:diacylglycerol kinase family protein [Phycisphaerales bacterium]